MQEFFDRIGYKGNLEDIAKTICRDFKIGKLLSVEIVPVGYEDFNISIETDRGKYFAKIFSNFRTTKDCRRCVEILEKVTASGINHPKLHASSQGFLHVLKLNKNLIRFCLMDFINGKDLFSLEKSLDKNEMKLIAKQAAIINSTKIKPSFIYDSWAIYNFGKEFKEKGRYLKGRDLKNVKFLANEFKNIDIKKLPHCFVHGDIIATNVIEDKQKNLWIVDFSVSNYYPRIMELAVLACNLLFDKNSAAKSRANLDLALKEYKKTLPLTKMEIEILPTFVKFAHAMHVLRAFYEKVVNRNSTKENEYFLNLGRTGLQQLMK